MKRLGRWAVITMCGMWLLLTLAVVGVWVAGRSHFPSGPDRQVLLGRWRYQLSDSRNTGCIGILIYHDWPTPSVGPPLALTGGASPTPTYTPEAMAWYHQQPTGGHYRGFGFGYDNDTYFELNRSQSMVAIGRYVGIGIPFWVAWVMWVPLLVALATIRRRRLIHSRQKRGLCTACGYDLRATPGRCPECGTTAPASPQNGLAV